MKLITISPKKALKPFLKQKPLRSDIDRFKANLIKLLDQIAVIEQQSKEESEEHLKNDIRDFLLDTYYKESNAINTKDKKDLVIHLGKTINTEVGVIIEAKRPSNVGEMISAENPNKKALYELILYYFTERNGVENNQLKQLIITNINEWYIIDANYFDKHIYRNSQIKKAYETKVNDKKDNPWFYEEVGKIVSKLDAEIPCVYFDIRSYDKVLRNSAKEDDKELIALFKILSPQHLLKIATANDSNSLNEGFYRELLHIIGLEPAKEGGKNIIRRKITNRNQASLLELTIDAIETEEVLHRIPDQSVYGVTREERVFNVALELCITWINRILFLKLLEGQLISYHQGNKEYRFLNKEMINDFDELFKLFHKVLAINLSSRTEAINKKFGKVPYLNSSLFEISDLEDQSIKINALDDNVELELISNTVLKDVKKEKMATIDYLFHFLDAYDFSNEGAEDIQEDSKTLITASVLGKVFEKINGYKDGSIFTPAFITMYMCKQSIRLAVVEKFNSGSAENSISKEKQAETAEKYKSIGDVYNAIGKDFTKERANELINSLKICDPAVGSGHFLVSALNEIIAIKSELGVLMDEKGKTLRDYEIEIINDELIITDEDNNIISYNPKNKESNRVQKTLFNEKRTIIENCLFGVDINPNSVKICRLRLWIELLKNAYYKEETNYTELETLPNIDINIKCGNSLLSRFALDADLTQALKSIKYDIHAYRGFVHDYKNEKNREVKRGLQLIIDTIKGDFKVEITKTGSDFQHWYKAKGELDLLTNQLTIFEKTVKEKKKYNDDVALAVAKLTKFETKLDEIKTNAVYKNAFEWRFEFPEVLDNKGEFVGFDVVIGNPPYIQLQSMGNDTTALANANYKTFARTGDIYSLFYERGNNILKTKGTLAFITSNKWMRADYGQNTRRYIAENTNPIYLIDFGMVMVFDMATVYSNVLIFNKLPNSNELLAVRAPNDYDLKTDLFQFTAKNFARINVNENAWVIQSTETQQIKRKVENMGVPLSEWNIKINYGVKTGYNEAFIIDGATKDRLIQEDNKSLELIKPILRGQDIKAWQPAYADLWIIFIPKGTTIKKNLSKSDPNHLAEPMPRYGTMLIGDATNWFKNEYPALFNHLISFKDKAELRLDQGDFWWEQRACSYIEEFLCPKIIYPNMTKFLPFVYDEKGYITNQKCFIITSEDACLKYLTAFLNSKTFKFCFKDSFPELLGNTFELSKIFFEQIPVMQISDALQHPFITLVDQIIALKQNGKNTTELEKQIDNLVYELYDITAEERAIIEGV